MTAQIGAHRCSLRSPTDLELVFVAVTPAFSYLVRFLAVVDLMVCVCVWCKGVVQGSSPDSGTLAACHRFPSFRVYGLTSAN